MLRYPCGKTISLFRHNLNLFSCPNAEQDIDSELQSRGWLPSVYMTTVLNEATIASTVVCGFA
jgi:hypothetical protein